MTVSLIEALTLDGVKVKPLAPTWTCMFAAETVEARVARTTEAREKCILIIFKGVSF